MDVLGLCGGIGAGKSAVASILANHHGAHVIDVDALGRNVLDPGTSAHAAVLARFGQELLAADGTIDRAALAAIVFSDPDQLRALEAISHPAINKMLDGLLVLLPEETFVVLDMAILVESTLGQDLASGRGYNSVLVVEADLNVRMHRLTELRGMSAEDAHARMASQASDAERVAVASHVVHNNGTVQELEAAVARFMATSGR